MSLPQSSLENGDASAGGADQAAAFRFLDLPKGVRFVFYDHAFHGLQVEAFTRTNGPKDDEELELHMAGDSTTTGPSRMVITGPGRKFLGLPLACKQVFAETRHHLVQSTALVLNINPSVCGVSTIPTLLLGCLSDFTLDNLRLLDCFPIMPWDPMSERAADAVHFRRIFRQLPSLRFCVGRRVGGIPASMEWRLEVFRAQGLFCHENDAPSPRDILDELGIDPSRPNSIQLIIPMSLKPHERHRFHGTEQMVS